MIKPRRFGRLRIRMTVVQASEKHVRYHLSNATSVKFVKTAGRPPIRPAYEISQQQQEVAESAPIPATISGPHAKIRTRAVPIRRTLSSQHFLLRRLMSEPRIKPRSAIAKFESRWWSDPKSYTWELLTRRAERYKYYKQAKTMADRRRMKQMDQYDVGEDEDGIDYAVLEEKWQDRQDLAGFRAPPCRRLKLEYDPNDAPLMEIDLDAEVPWSPHPPQYVLDPRLQRQRSVPVVPSQVIPATKETRRSAFELQAKVRALGIADKKRMSRIMLEQHKLTPEEREEEKKRLMEGVKSLLEGF